MRAPPFRTPFRVGLVVLACIAVFVGCAVAASGSPSSVDTRVLSWFVDHRDPTTIAVSRVIGAIGRYVGLVVVSAVVAVALLLRRAPVALAFAPMAALTIASLASTAIKGLTDRARPPVQLQEATVSLSSFPSGHATDAAAFFVATALVVLAVVDLDRGARRAVLLAGAFATAVVGVSRWVLAVHWFTDVIAGWALGTCVAVVVVAVVRGRDGRTEERRPSP